MSYFSTFTPRTGKYHPTTTGAAFAARQLQEYADGIGEPGVYWITMNEYSGKTTLHSMVYGIKPIEKNDGELLLAKIIK